ncbi:hypothetical protein Dimus_038532 [Dionaea muscipula]
MTPRMEWFISYRSVPHGVSIHMGDGSVCRVSGMDSIRIRIFDGSVVVLHGIRHVPGLKRNLLSLGSFDDNGYRQSIFGVSFRLSCGSRIVIKGCKIRGLYLLNGSTVCGFDAVLASSTVGSTSGGVWRVMTGLKKRVPFEVESGPVIFTGVGESTLPTVGSVDSVATDIARTREWVILGSASSRPRHNFVRPVVHASRASANLEPGVGGRVDFVGECCFGVLGGGTSDLASPDFTRLASVAGRSRLVRFIPFRELEQLLVFFYVLLCCVCFGLVIGVLL